MTDETNEMIEYALSNIRKALELVPDCDGVATVGLYGQLKCAEYYLTRGDK